MAKKISRRSFIKTSVAAGGAAALLPQTLLSSRMKTRVKLGYIGTAYNNLNSESISLIDRMKPYQYLYNIIMYRMELDLASDKGKKFCIEIKPSRQCMNQKHLNVKLKTLFVKIWNMSQCELYQKAIA